MRLWKHLLCSVSLLTASAGCDQAKKDPVGQDGVVDAVVVDTGGSADAVVDTTPIDAPPVDTSPIDTPPIDSVTADEIGPPEDSIAPPDAADAHLYCDPNPCQTPAGGCSDDRTAQVELAASCAEGDEGPICSDELGPLELCEAGPCVLGACLVMHDKCTWPYTDRISWVSELRFHGEPPCCHDFDGDGADDNAFSTLMAQLAPAVGDFDDWMAMQIDEHHMNLLFDVMGLDEPLSDPIDDPSIDVIGYESNFDNVVFVEPTTGMASMKLKLLSFIDEVGFMPRNRAAGRIDQGHISVSHGRLAFIFFLNDQVVELLVEGFAFEGDVALGPNGAGLAIDGDSGRGARAWGHITRDSFLTAINGNFQWECCTTFAVEDGEVPLNLAEGRCNTPISSCEESLDMCRGLADPDTCNLVFTLLAPDVDADGDGAKESLSVGFHFKATSASIGWIEGCGPAPVP